MSRIALLAVALALIVVAFPNIALAHAKLTASTPADGATVPPGLTQIAMTFAEETSVDQSNAQLLDSKGQQVAGSNFAVDRADRTKMTITTPPLAAGTYTVKYKTVTEDDNGIVNGSFTFTVASEAVGDSVSATVQPTETADASSPIETPLSLAGGGSSNTTGTTSTTGGTSQGSLPVTGAGDITGLVVLAVLAGAAIVASAGLAIRKKSSL